MSSRQTGPAFPEADPARPVATQSTPRPRTVGLLTIGQSPRPDVVPQITAYLGRLPGFDALRILEAGALDGLTPIQIRELAPKGAERRLVSRLSTGGTVVVAERLIPPLLEVQAARLSGQGAEALALLCTGDLPAVRSPVPILRPQALMSHLVAAALPGARLGVIVPLAEQVADARQRWGELARTLRPDGAVAVETASPYETDPAGLVAAAGSLGAWGAGVIILDCMAFTPQARDLVRDNVPVPVILPRTVLAGALAELLA